MPSMLKSLSALAATLRSCAGDLSLTMATLASVTSSMASLRRQADMCQPGRVPLASAAGNGTHGTADLAKANPEKGQVHGRAGRKRSERSSQAVHAALDEMHDVFLRQLEALLGTLNTLRMLMNLVPARAYVVKTEGAGAVASFRLSFLSIMSRSIDALHSQPHLADSFESEQLCGDPWSGDPAGHGSRLQACVWNALLAAASLGKEPSFIDELVLDAPALRALCLSLTSRSSSIASAAAGVVAVLASSGNARHKLLSQGQGFLEQLMVRCSVGETIELRSAAAQALHALVRGPEARRHLHNLKRLLSRNSLLALGAACLTTTWDKLRQLEASIRGCNVVQVIAEVEQAMNAHAISLDEAPSVIFDEIKSSADSVVRLQKALDELEHEQASLPLTLPPASFAADNVSMTAFRMRFEDVSSHADSLLKASHLVARVAIERPNVQRQCRSACRLRDSVQKQLKSSRNQQRMSERLVSAANPGLSLILDDERAHLQDEDAKVGVLTRMAELLGQLCRCLLEALDALAGLQPLGAQSTLECLNELAQLVKDETNRRALAKGELGDEDGVVESEKDLRLELPRVRLVRQLRLVSGLHFVNDRCMENALGFMHCILALDQDLAKHAASNGVLELVLHVVKVNFCLVRTSDLPMSAPMLLPYMCATIPCRWHHGSIAV